MSDFSDRPFAVGTLTGLRAFTIDSLGRLRAPQQETIWRPGENVAECRCDEVMEQRYSSFGMKWNSSLSNTSSSKRYHKPGSMNKGCGFYAYTDGSNDYHKPLAQKTVQAVVEGYGVCTVGSRGFRSEKAKVVALVDPNGRSFLKRGSTSFIVWDLIFGIYNAAFAVYGIVDLNWWRIAFNGALALLFAVSLIFNVRWRKTYKKSRERFELASALYPEAKIYKSIRAALREHPLTVPPKPSPDTDDNFWTSTEVR